MTIDELIEQKTEEIRRLVKVIDGIDEAICNLQTEQEKKKEQAIRLRSDITTLKRAQELLNQEVK